jgi:hypothetical protein
MVNIGNSMEKISYVQEIHDFKPKADGWYSCDGFEIVTDKQTIRFGISNGQSCCEDWGYLTTNDNLDDFIGAEIREITKTDTALDTKKIADRFEYGFYEGGIIFINIETDKGTLQLAAYNSHNGYYGHSVYMESEQLTFHDGV